MLNLLFFILFFIGRLNCVNKWSLILYFHNFWNFEGIFFTWWITIVFLYLFKLLIYYQIFTVLIRLVTWRHVRLALIFCSSFLIINFLNDIMGLFLVLAWTLITINSVIRLTFIFTGINATFAFRQFLFLSFKSRFL